MTDEVGKYKSGTGPVKRYKKLGHRLQMGAIALITEVGTGKKYWRWRRQNIDTDWPYKDFDTLQGFEDFVNTIGYDTNFEDPYD